uniref:Uncharacterized protein n=1 Tax=Meloidogyne floridensis TaxID=298350 RepID=A0A915NX18_9BILA
LPGLSQETSNTFLTGIDETKLDEKYVNIFFNDKNSPYDEKTNKIWEKLSGFIIAKSDSKDFEKENFDNDLNEENEDSEINREYIQYLHTKLLPENWVEIEDIKEIRKQSLLYNHLNSMEQTEYILKVKSKMRTFLGEWLFVELEMKQPILFRLDLMEYELKIVLYKQLFSKPLNISTKNGADIQLNFSYLFKEIIANINLLSKEKLLKIFRTFWNKKMINIKPNFELMCELANFLLAIQGSKSKINIEKVKLGLEKVELLHEIHEEEIINLFKNNDGIFRKFIKETWGTRSRIIIYLNKNQEIVQIMVEEGYNNSLKEMLEIELTENELKELLVNSYKIGFKNDIMKANLEDVNKLTCNGFTSD